jgi:hypothetical protein
MPANSFGSVPTPAIVSPIEFTLRLDDYQALGGHMDRVQTLQSLLDRGGYQLQDAVAVNPWPLLLPPGAHR